MHNGPFSEVEYSSAMVCDDFRDCPEILSSIAELFRETYPFDINDLRVAHAARDSQLVAFMAHKIRGSIMIFHLEGAARAASELEEKAGRGDLQGTDQLVEQLGDAFHSACCTVDQAGRELGFTFTN